MNFQYLENFMEQLTQWRTPGNAIRVYMDGREVFRHQAGFSDLENHVKMTGHELFNLYSCSKPATVTAALQLYEQGKFLLSDPLYDYIPEYRDTPVRAKDGSLVKCARPITLRHLFTMTAGFSCDYTRAVQKARERSNGKTETLTVIRALAEDPLHFQPGEHWLYGLSHDVLAAVVEIISGKRFADYVKENIFDPLEMTHSSYHLAPDAEPLMAQQYAFRNAAEAANIQDSEIVEHRQSGVLINVGKAASLRFGPEYDSGGAGIISTADDYIKFVAALANFGLGLNGERILSPGTVELLRTNHLTAAQSADYNWSHTAGYGYGLGVRTSLDRAAGGLTGSLGEFGWGSAVGDYFLADPERNLAVFYVQHLLNPDNPHFIPRLRNVLYTCIDRE